jgi:uroporphyrinogen III methyltransferase/synthase
MRSTPLPGMVYLVGAGPGDPGLITLRGVECLRRADVVLYDYLANPRLLEHASPHAERVFLGRHGHHAPEAKLWTQPDVNQRMIEDARRGKCVVRLKSGDPAVFARSAEEIEALTAAEIPFEVVPGITAALAVASYAGVPLTHRDAASAVALVTGQQKPSRLGEEVHELDYPALAAFPGTLVFYMGVTTAQAWTSALISAGKPPDTAAAIVRRVSWPDQKAVHCTLAEVPAAMANHQVRPPVLVIVGDAVEASTASSWFTERPLFGRTVLVTRPAHQAASLVAPLEELGAEVLIQPAIEIGDPADWKPVDAALNRLRDFDWLVFSSANGVRSLIERLFTSGCDLRALGPLKLAAIGPGTAEELARYHLQADLQPDEFRAESLAAALIAEQPQGRFLLVRASRGREVLADDLRAASASVEQIVVYESRDVAQPDESIRSRLAAGEIHWITVTSSAIARSLANLFGDDLRRARLASISPITTATLAELGHSVAAEASRYTMAGVVEAIMGARSQGS